MPAAEDIASFIRSSFRSVWTLELLLHLKRHPDRDWSTADLVSALRASELVVANGLETLLAAGLILVGKDGSVRYGPASPEIEEKVDAVGALYAKKPDAVRRMIVAAGVDGVTAFADAFKLRRD